MDRHAINQALAKCIAYQQCGKPEEAKVWFERLTALLGRNRARREQNAVLRELCGTSAAAARRDMGM